MTRERKLSGSRRSRIADDLGARVALGEVREQQRFVLEELRALDHFVEMHVSLGAAVGDAHAVVEERDFHDEEPRRAHDLLVIDDVDQRVAGEGDVGDLDLARDLDVLLLRAGVGSRAAREPRTRA